MSPLQNAAAFGHSKVVELLIANGANVNMQNLMDLTALDQAEMLNFTNTIDLLRKHGGKTGAELNAEGSQVLVIPPAQPEAAKRMTNGVPLALDDELQNRNDGKWYWKGTTNLFTGIELNHHTNGVLKLRLPFTNGVPHGRRIMWHPNGQKQSEGDVENGARSGLWNSWFPNGKKDKQGTFVNGNPDGLQIFWHTNGVRSVEWYHKEGYPHGEMKSYHPNGQPNQQGAFLEGKQNGNWIAWDENGNKVREALFLKGKLITEKMFDESPDANKTKPAPQGDGG